MKLPELGYDSAMKKTGKHSNDLHNLVYLAELAGLLRPSERPETRELLNYATEAIRWLGRYPVPKNSNLQTAPTGHLPLGAFGFHFTDFISEFLDEIDNAFELARDEVQDEQELPQ